jgi:glycosyltransferase involved in cell wall biosynthesis
MPKSGINVLLKVSVIIPAKNESKFIGNTLQAVEQSLKIVVIDDGSSDDTASIAKNYTDNVIILPNTGMRAVGRPHLAEV